MKSPDMKSLDMKSLDMKSLDMKSLDMKSLNAKGEGGLQWREFLQAYSTYVVLAALIAVACAMSRDFRTSQNISNLLSQISVVGILAIGQMMVMLTGGFDLGHGSYVSLVSVLFACFLPMGMTAAIVLVAASFLVLGAVNGFFVNKGVSSFIVTLGAMGVARSLALFLAKGNAVNLTDQSIKFLAYGDVYGVPVCVALWLFLVVVSTLALRDTKIGRHVYAYGGNPESARLSGVNTKAVIYFVFVVSALLSVAAGLIYVAKLGVALPNMAVGYEMDSIAGSVIGGTSLFGGVGSVPKTLVGVLIYGMITNLLNIMGVSAYWQDVAKGLIVLVTVYFNSRKWGARGL
ncbi:sugar ABC transporter permease [Synergistales bacterium]|nr:sugar ABC transporter permease [Synergistales bacterium]